MCPEVDIKSPTFMLEVAIMYLTLSPLATKAIFALRQGSYCKFKTFSTSGGPSFGPTRQLSTHLYFFL